MIHCKLILPLAAVACLTAGCASHPSTHNNRSFAPPSASALSATSTAEVAHAALVEQVAATERAFAQTLQDRDLGKFVSFIAPEAAFFSGNSVAHGPVEIANDWAPYFQGKTVPFSWRPDHVEVLTSGTLALSTGPVVQQGRVVGRFDSIWRLDAPHTWHIVFDKGEPVCTNNPLTPQP
jgi:ketosteroid isomerase-like protein